MGRIMSLRRFRRLAGRYGAELERWPPGDRQAARILADTSLEAHQVLQDEEPLDLLLHDAFASRDALDWVDGEEAAAMARLQEVVGARIADEAGNDRAKPDNKRYPPDFETVSGSGGVLAGAAGPQAALPRLLGMVLGGCLIIAAGFWVGSSQTQHVIHPDLLGEMQALPLGAMVG